jgi:class 3 adenylate cyclase
VPGEPADEPLGCLLVDHGGRKFTVPVYDQLFVGRECAGISDQRRLVIRDKQISRCHLEIRLDAVGDHACLIDTSTNGTLLNDVRLDRAVPVPIMPDDKIRIGNVTLTFKSSRFTERDLNDSVTVCRISSATMMMVVGDITNYSTIAQGTDNTVVAESLYVLWKELRRVLRTYSGTLNHYAGDALYAVWDMQTQPQAIELAVDFALAANQRVEEIGPELPLRGPDGSAVKMGWAVVQGTAALAAMTRSVEAIIGDSTNLAFRLAGLAGRNGRAPVMVTDSVRNVVSQRYIWGTPEQVEVKGRHGTEIVVPVISLAPSQRCGAPTAEAVIVTGADVTDSAASASDEPTSEPTS